MSKSRLLFLGVALLAMSACDRTKQGGEQAAPEAAVPVDVAAPAVEPVAAGAPADVPKVMVSDVEIGFPHIVRSNAEDIVDGAKRHTLRVEYTEGDETEIAAKLSSAFSAAGYKVKADGLKFVAFGESKKVRYVVSPAGPDLQVKLSSPESKGLVTFMW